MLTNMAKTVFQREGRPHRRLFKNREGLSVYCRQFPNKTPYSNWHLAKRVIAQEQPSQ